jgi:hypothetical protein
MSTEHDYIYEAHAVDINEEEHRILKAHEPGISFKDVRPDGLSQGRQSRVSVLEYQLDNQPYTVMWKRMGAGKGLGRDEASELAARIGPYKQSLEAVGWQVPKLFHSKVIDLSGETQIFSYEEYIAGGDGENLISSPEEPRFRKWYLVEETIRILAAYPEQQLQRRQIKGQELTLLPHGLDLKAANVVLERGTDQLYFVDLFGTKELDASGRWLTYFTKLDPLPAENLLAVCATREGAILRFWRLARRLWEPDRSRRTDLDAEFVSHLATAGLPSREFEFVRDEIQGAYHWLDGLYTERHI